MKNILITGGSKGIGKQLVRAFAQKGHQVSFTWQYSATEAAALVEELNAAGCTMVMGLQCDMGNEAAVRELFREHKDRLKDIDILINNAGVRDQRMDDRLKPFIMTSSSDWWGVMTNNVNGVLNTCRMVLPSMIRRKSGRIINITSLAGIKGNAGQSAYAASKAAITAFSRSLAKEIGDKGVTINCVAPGFIMTERLENQPEKYFTDRVGQSLLKRMGSIEEIANLVGYLALDAPEFLINQEIVIDGGAI